MAGFAAAAIGTNIVLGVWGGSQADKRAQQAQDAQEKAMKAASEYSWKEAEDTYEWANYELDVAKANDATFRALKDTLAIEDYARANKIRDMQTKSDILAFNKSEGQYAQNRDYNAIAAQLATDDQDQWLYESILDLDFQLKDLNLAEGQANAMNQINIAKISADFGLKSNELQGLFNLQRQTNKLAQEEKRAEAAFKGTKGEIERLKAVGKARAGGQSGRSARKNVQSILSETGINKDSLLDSLTRSESSHRLAQQRNSDKYYYSQKQNYLGKEFHSILENTKFDFAKKSFDMGRDKLEASADSVRTKHEANMLKIAHDKYAADVAADSRRISKPVERLPIAIPYASPETIWTRPRKPRKPPETVSAGQVGRPNTWSAVAKGFGDLAKAASKVDWEPKIDTSNIDFSGFNNDNYDMAADIDWGGFSTNDPGSIMNVDPGTFDGFSIPDTPA